MTAKPKGQEKKKCHRDFKKRAISLIRCKKYRSQKKRLVNIIVLNCKTSVQWKTEWTVFKMPQAS